MVPSRFFVQNNTVRKVSSIAISGLPQVDNILDRESGKLMKIK